MIDTLKALNREAKNGNMAVVPEIERICRELTLDTLRVKFAPSRPFPSHLLMDTFLVKEVSSASNPTLWYAANKRRVGDLIRLHRICDTRKGPDFVVQGVEVYTWGDTWSRSHVNSLVNRLKGSGIPRVDVCLDGPVFLADLTKIRIGGKEPGGFYVGESVFIGHTRGHRSFTFFHELGHRYWAKSLSDAAKRRWNASYRKADAPTEYARTNAEEAFCESFRLYVEGKLKGRYLTLFERVVC